MLLLGLIIIAIGAVLVIGGVFASDVSGGQVGFMGIDVSPTALFLLGAIGGACILFGLSVTRFGARRELKQRKEQKKMGKLADKLDRAEAGRRRDLDDDER